MKIRSRKKGNSLVEYTLIIVLVGLMMISLCIVPSSKNNGKYTNQENYTTFFKNSFAGSTSIVSKGITIGPLADQ